MSHPSRWSPRSREASYRRAAVRRVKRLLEHHPPSAIDADPVVIEQALYEIQRETDADDDRPRRNY